MDWKKIWTAPRDGKAIIGYEPGCGVGIVHWQKSVSGWRDYAGATMRPTHYMDIPALPESEKEVAA